MATGVTVWRADVADLEVGVSRRQVNEVKSGQRASDQQAGFWRADNFRWISIAVVLLLGVVFNDYLRHISFSLCLLVWCAILTGCGWFASGTTPGQEFRKFLELACRELRQVIWPSRDEVVRTTIMVGAIVFVVSFALWLIDVALVHVLGMLIGA